MLSESRSESRCPHLLNGMYRSWDSEKTNHNWIIGLALPLNPPSHSTCSKLHESIWQAGTCIHTYIHTYWNDRTYSEILQSILHIFLILIINLFMLSSRTCGIGKTNRFNSHRIFTTHISHAHMMQRFNHKYRLSWWQIQWQKELWRWCRERWDRN